MTKERFSTPVAVFILLIKNNKILLHRRQNTGWQDGMLDVPSGHLEANEGLRECASRELEEETGVRARKDRMRVVHTIHCRFGAYTYFQFYLEPQIFEGKPSIKEPEKCSEMGWYELDQLPSDLVPYVQQALVMIQNNEHYSEYGCDNYT